MIKLITVLVAGIPAIIASVLAFMARKWGTVAASLAVMVTLTGAFVVAMSALLSTAMGYISVPGWFQTALGFGIPGNFVPVLAVICAAKATRAAYDMAMEKTRLFNNAS